MNTQNINTICETDKNIKMKRLYILVLTILICGSGIFGAYRYAASRKQVDLTEKDETAMKGTPNVGKESGYSELVVSDKYRFSICGFPSFGDNNLAIYLTDPLSADVSIRAEVLNEKGDVIGRSGVVSPGEYIEKIELSEQVEKNDEVSIRIVGYNSDMTSAGNVVVKVTTR